MLKILMISDSNIDVYIINTFDTTNRLIIPIVNHGTLIDLEHCFNIYQNTEIMVMVNGKKSP